MAEGTFDVAIIGTGLVESIVAAALSKAGYKVAHVDENPYYGGEEASLSLDELIEWVDMKASSNDPCFSSIQRSQNTLPQSRQYSICLCPSIIPSIGPMISSLVSSGVSKYGGFRLLERVGIYHQTGVIKNVPGTKEDVFKSKDMNLIDKRRLMRFLLFCVGDFETTKEFEENHHIPFAEFLKSVFSLKDEVVTAVVYSLACCFSPSDLTSPALNRIRRYLRSAGRYGPSPFLVGHYGGVGDIAQGFCRAAAVSGAVYILGRKLVSVKRVASEDPLEVDNTHPGRYSLTLQDFPDALKCNVIVSSSIDIPADLKSDTNYIAQPEPENPYVSSSIVRCIAIIDHPVYFPSVVEPGLSEEPTQIPSLTHQAIDTAVLVFPPSTIPGGSTTTAATALITGEGAMSTPKGRWILYIALPLATVSLVWGPTSAQELIQPYLDAALTLTIPPVPFHSSDAGFSPPTAPPQPLFTTFYIQHTNTSTLPPEPAFPQAALEVSRPKTCIVPPPLTRASPLPDLPDIAATRAETVYWEVIRLLKNEMLQNTTNTLTDPEVESFWPSLSIENESDDEGW